MRVLQQEIRYGIRLLLKNPVFTTAAIACLALGMGATTAIFSVVSAVVLRPLPYRESGRLVRLYSEFPNFPGGGLRRFWISPPEYLDLKRETNSWESLDGWVVGAANLAGAAEPVRATAAYVTGNLMHSLGVSPALGRSITAQDDAPGAPLVAVISYGLWQRAYGGDPRIAGRDIHHDGTKCTVVGVMPKGFRFPPGEVDAPELWVPLQLDPANPGGRGSHYLSLLGRLKPGVSFRRAQEELSGLVRQWGDQSSPNNHTFHPETHPIVSYLFQDEVVRTVRPAMLMLMGAVGFVLLIACVNVANLLLARAESRQREIAVRTAMGAALPRLIRQFLIEGLLLSFSGAVFGSLLAYAGVRLIAATNAGSIPRANEVSIDGTVLAFTLLVSAGTGIFFGLSPITHMRTRHLAEALKASSSRNTAGGGSQAFRRALVIGELALALVLLIGSGLMVRAFWRLQEINTGVVPERLLTMHLSLTPAVYTTPQSGATFWMQLQQRLSNLPGVESASFATGLPPSRRLNANDTQIEGFVAVPNGPVQNVDFWQIVGNRYFEIMGIRLIEGRFFDGRDGKDAPAAVIVNQTMARHFWGNQSPIGKRVRPGFRDPWRTVVGVVADVKNAGIDMPTGTELYFPYEQALSSGSVTPGCCCEPVAIQTLWSHPRVPRSVTLMHPCRSRTCALWTGSCPLPGRARAS
ncbi:MAG: ABC transporter permease [Bryobacteraceae bacterium]